MIIFCNFLSCSQFTSFDCFNTVLLWTPFLRLFLQETCVWIYQISALSYIYFFSSKTLGDDSKMFPWILPNVDLGSSIYNRVGLLIFLFLIRKYCTIDPIVFIFTKKDLKIRKKMNKRIMYPFKSYCLFYFFKWNLMAVSCYF